MAGNPKKHAKKLANIKQRGLDAAAASEEQAGPETKPLSVTTPVLQGEVLPPTSDTEPTRTALKRAMRAKAQEHAETAIAVLVGNLNNPGLDPRVRQQAANDILAWGFGKPATEIEAGEGAQMIVIQKFREDA